VLLLALPIRDAINPVASISHTTGLHEIAMPVANALEEFAFVFISFLLVLLTLSVWQTIDPLAIVAIAV